MKIRGLFVAALILIYFSGVGCTKSTQVKTEKKTPSSDVYSPKLLATGSAGMNDWSAPQPGEAEVQKRTYPIAPPVVPHSIEEYKIGGDQNDCMGCHEQGVEMSKGHVATKIPESHRVNPFTGEKVKSGVVGMRYNCVQCHVPQAR